MTEEFDRRFQEYCDREVPECVLITDDLLQQLGQRAAKQFSDRTGVPMAWITEVELLRVGERLFTRSDTRLVLFYNDQCKFGVHFVDEYETRHLAYEWVEQIGRDLRSFTF